MQPLVRLVRKDLHEETLWGLPVFSQELRFHWGTSPWFLPKLQGKKEQIFPTTCSHTARPLRWAAPLPAVGDTGAGLAGTRGMQGRKWSSRTGQLSTPRPRSSPKHPQKQKVGKAEGVTSLMRDKCHRTSNSTVQPGGSDAGASKQPALWELAPSAGREARRRAVIHPALWPGQQHQGGHGQQKQAVHLSS